MKRKFVFVVLIFFCVFTIKSQGKRNSNMPMIGDDAPKFIAESTTGTLAFPRDYGKHWKILKSTLIALQSAYE